jgi:hypothetical protein
MGDDCDGACWLCTFSSDEIAQTVSAMIVENAHMMSVETIAEQASAQIEEAVQTRYGEAGDLAGSSPAHVRRHVRNHVLHANVALAVTLRGLLEVSDQLRRQIRTVDEESGQTIIDAAQVSNYLAVTAQVAGLYKLGDGARLLFARRDKAGN